MSTGSESTSDVVKQFGKSATDTGSPEVQVALLTKRIQGLGHHFSKHTSDNHSRRGMLQLISRRKRLLQYLKNNDIERYRNTISQLGLRK